MALVQYTPRAPTHVSRFSGSSSRTSRPSSHTHRSSSTAPSRDSSSRYHSSSSAGSSYTSISTRTFGISSRPGYAPGQAPHDYFYNEDAREEWESASLDDFGRRVRATRIRGRGSEWPAQDAYASPMPSIHDRPSERGSRHLRYDEREDEAWENDTVSPADSISQISSHPSGHSSRRSGRSGVGPSRDHYPQSGYSRRPSMVEDGREGVYAGSGGSRMGSGMMSMANGRLVRIEEPDWS